MLKALAAPKLRLYRLEARGNARQSAGVRRCTAAVWLEVGAFQAHPAVVLLAVAQGQALGQVVGVCRPNPARSELQHACREGRNLGIVPLRRMAAISIAFREPVGPSGGLYGRFCAVGRARLGVASRRPANLELRCQASGNRLAAVAGPQPVSAAGAGSGFRESCFRNRHRVRGGRLQQDCQVVAVRPDSLAQPARQLGLWGNDDLVVDQVYRQAGAAKVFE